ncbi:MAG: YihY/virulence factor BrkB family protein [Candidatus Sulfobium sp.]
MKHPGRFFLDVLRGFRKNQGLLLSGAVAYYTLLSLIPMLILILVVLSHFVDQNRLMATVSSNLAMVVPGYAAALTHQVRVFIENRHVVGVVGSVSVLFFSSLAFSVLENAMSVIFFHRARVHHRHFLVSALIPYVYIFLVAMGMLVISLISGALQTLEARQMVILGWSLSLEGASRFAVYAMGIAGEVLMLTSLYLVMPVGRITFRHALVGGISATILWEITRRVLVWYYSTLSLVNVIYGSFAAAVVTLLSIEVAAVILLLGAQVIAELDRKMKPATEGKKAAVRS